MAENEKHVRQYIALDLKPKREIPVIQIWSGMVTLFRSRIMPLVVLWQRKCLNMYPILKKLMTEILRVLKPGGRLFFTVPFLWRLTHCSS